MLGYRRVGLPPSWTHLSTPERKYRCYMVRRTRRSRRTRALPAPPRTRYRVALEARQFSERTTLLVNNSSSRNDTLTDTLTIGRRRKRWMCADANQPNFEGTEPAGRHWTSSL